MSFSSAGWRKNGLNKVEFQAVDVLYEFDQVPRLSHYEDRRRTTEAALTLCRTLGRLLSRARTKLPSLMRSISAQVRASSFVPKSCRLVLPLSVTAACQPPSTGSTTIEMICVGAGGACTIALAFHDWGGSTGLAVDDALPDGHQYFDDTPALMNDNRAASLVRFRRTAVGREPIANKSVSRASSSHDGNHVLNSLPVHRRVAI
jgi:hypothetical protein